MPATAKVGTRAVVIDQRSGQGRPSDPTLRDELRFIASSSSLQPLYSSTLAPSHPSAVIGWVPFLAIWNVTGQPPAVVLSGLD